MLLRVTFALAVVCAATVELAQADRADRFRDGVKLCGRELIRAVIFTCGGSRWRRALELDLDPFQSSYYSDVTQGDDNTRQNGVIVTDSKDLDLPTFRYTLADLMALFGRDTGHPASMQDALQEFHLSIISGDQEKRTNAELPKSRRGKRNLIFGVAGMCCNQGCTMEDIGHLC